MSKKKATGLIDKIIKAKDRDSGLEALNDILEALYLSNSYTEMVRLRDELEAFQKEFRVISSKLEKTVEDYDDLSEIRVKLNFLYRDIMEDLSSDINFHKIFYEEAKTVRRAKGLKELKGSETAQDFKANSTSALREILGDSKTYQEYVAEYAIAYSNWKTLDNLLNSIRMTVDAVASREKKELLIEQKKAR